MSLAARLAVLASVLVIVASAAVGLTLTQAARADLAELAAASGGELTRAAAEARATRYVRRAAIVTGIVATGGVALAVLTGFFLAAPLGRLRRATREMADGEYTLALDTVPVDGPRESRELAVAFRRAVSEVSKREKALEAVNAELRRTEEARAAMSHMLVHDLKGPIGNVATLLKLLETGALDDEDRELVIEAGARCRDLLHMIGDLLDVARLEQGRMPIAPVSCDVAELIDGALAQIAHLAQGQGFEVRVHVDDEAGEIVCDPRLMERVLINLLVNALRHGRSPVDLTATPEDDQLVVAVEDAGAGVPEGEEARVFEKFGALGRGGAGLGLAFVRMAVEAHGGGIGVRGARFTVYLPSEPPPS